VVSAFQLSSRTCFPSETKRTLPPPVPPYASLEMPDVPQMQFRFVLTPQARTAPLLWIPSSSHSCSRHNEPALKPNSGSAHAKTQQGTHTHRESGMPRCSDFNNPAPAPATGTTVSQPVSPRSSSARAAARSRGEFVSWGNGSVVAEEPSASLRRPGSSPEAGCGLVDVLLRLLQCELHGWQPEDVRWRWHGRLSPPGCDWSASFPQRSWGSG